MLNPIYPEPSRCGEIQQHMKPDPVPSLLLHGPTTKRTQIANRQHKIANTCTCNQTHKDILSLSLSLALSLFVSLSLTCKSQSWARASPVKNESKERPAELAEVLRRIREASRQGHESAGCKYGRCAYEYAYHHCDDLETLLQRALRP